jgi:uncharacterized membrane protein
MKILRRAFAGASIGWAAALPIATLIASRQVTSPSVYLFGFAVYVVGSFVCHQRPERSFHLWAHQMPVCARCTGIYAGAALTALLWPVAQRFPVIARRLESTIARSPKGFALVACAPAAATLVYEWTTGVTPSNWIRAASGLWLGTGVALLVQRELH